MSFVLDTTLNVGTYTPVRFNIFRDLSLMASDSLRFHHACAPWLRWIYEELGWLGTSGHENCAWQKPAPIEILETLKLKVMERLRYQLVQDFVREQQNLADSNAFCPLFSCLIDVTKIPVASLVRLETKYKSACKRLYTKWIYLHMSSVYIKSLS